MIPYGSHSLSAEDVKAVANVLENEYLTQGQRVPAFEQALCDYTGASHAIAVNSGTSGLHIACLALGVTNGDTVWTVPNTFAASANCALYCGASIDFVDIDPETRNISVAALKKKIDQASINNTLPKALIVVHFAGHVCDMAAILEITAKHDIAIIEDAAHALGACYEEDVKAGHPKYSAMTVLSFHPVKSITSAEGGAVLTNNGTLAKKLKMYACHGITKEPGEFVHEKTGSAHYEQQFLGFNYRLSDLHAALGLSQLQRIDEFIRARLVKAKLYQTALESLPIKLPILDEKSAWHLYVIELIEHDRDSIFQQLRQRNIGVNVHYIPVHRHPYFQSLGFKRGQFPISERYYENAISIPLFSSLTEEQQEYVVNTLKELLL